MLWAAWESRAGKWARMDKRGSHEKLNIVVVDAIPPSLIYKRGVQNKLTIIIISNRLTRTKSMKCYDTIPFSLKINMLLQISVKFS